MTISFVKMVRNALLTLGAAETVRFDNPEFEVETSVGALRVAPRNGKIMCRFENPVEASKKVLCNRHTGKWNHFQMPNETVQEFVADFELSLVYLKGVQQ